MVSCESTLIQIRQCSETTLTGESRSHISTPLGIEPGSLMMGSKRVDHWTSGTVCKCSEIAGSAQQRDSNQEFDRHTVIFEGTLYKKQQLFYTYLNLEMSHHRHKANTKINKIILTLKPGSQYSVDLIHEKIKTKKLALLAL